MSDLSFIDNLYDPDLDALFAGELESLSNEGLDLLSNLDDTQLNRLLGREPAAPAEPARDLSEGLSPSEYLGSLAGAIEAEGGPYSEAGGKFMRGLEYDVGRYERGLGQLGATPAEKKALALLEEKARKDFEAIDAGIGAEDIPQAMMVLGSLLVPGGNLVQGTVGASKLITGLKNIPKTWGVPAVLAGVTEFFKGRTLDESRGGEALQAAGLTAAGGIAGHQVSRLLSNAFSTTGAGKSSAALLGASVGTAMSKRIFREGLIRRWAGAVTGRQKRDPMDSPMARSYLRRGGQEDARLLREQAGVEAKVAARPGVGAEDVEGFLDTFPQILKAVRPTKAAKEAGLTTKDLREEAQTMFSMIQENAIKTNTDGTSFIDVGTLRQNWAQLQKADNFGTVFSKPKQKQLASLIENYSRAAMTAQKNVGSAAAPYAKARAILQGERVAGRKDVEEYFAGMMGRPASPKYANTIAVATWMAQNEVDPAELADFQAVEGWLGNLELFETIAEQLESE